ncbi:general secretion pathway protein [Maritimibacter sp. 55A14]|uniref:type II and III secretion system protein family protein n=1 Tax=Maritimibacter sp. 55A14 TaxID=2174844 RepID=UPI000D61558E|nr:type II and III secretion system protein family protein [Maritimibacter sp. 55A14]PWE31986.1 general secretion pathway protein [Maritimibacter sp. 55A14]
MKLKRIFCASLFGLSVIATQPVYAQANETLRILRGGTSSNIKVSLNRAVVVESDVPFGEISVANPGIADIVSLSDRTIYVLGKAPGRTTMTLLGPDAGLITNVEVHVSPDTAEFKERLREILPGEPIEVRTANDGIVLSGSVSGKQRLSRALELAERYAPGRVSNLMTVGGTQQVMLKVRFAEMNRSVSKSLGSLLTFNDANGDFRVNGALGSGIGEPPTGTIGASLLGVGDFNLNLTLEALETKGLVRTLAEPNIVALSGETANFLAGGEVPIPVDSDEDGITVEFKPFGVEIEFTPTVVNDEVINLKLATAVSEIDEDNGIVIDGLQLTGFSRREAATTVELRDGESLAIAGLLQDDFNDLANQVPWIGDVPILGALFRSSSFERDQSELVVIITPHLVDPTRGEALALPTDRVRPPSENELFLFGQTAGRAKQQKGAAGEIASQDFNGSYGYVME